MSEKNELVIAESIDKELQKKRSETVFPLSPTHRKELRQLKSKNIGNLRSRLNTIKGLKKEEYSKKYSDDLAKELSSYEKNANVLNKDWGKIIENINKLIQTRIKLEEKYKVADKYSVKHDYGNFAELTEVKDKREVFINIKSKTRSILSDEFEEKYAEPFNQVGERIDRIEEQYEEAINFGDLEIVKRLYYTMKNADNLFKKIDELKV